jgi:hypothetical protein
VRTSLRWLFLVVPTVALAGCDQRRPQLATAPTLASFTVGVPGASFRLTPAERASILPEFDADALERLLAMVPPEARPRLLSGFQAPAPGERAGFVVRLGHPALQAQLEKVWAPFWESYSDKQMDEEVGYLPGRSAAKALRAQKANRPE